MQQHQTSSTKHTNATGPTWTIWILNSFYCITNRRNIVYVCNFVVLTILYCYSWSAATTTVVCCSACNIAAISCHFIDESQHLTDRPKIIVHNYLLLFSLVCSPSNVLYVHTSAPCKSNGSNLTSNQHKPYFRCVIAPPKYHTAVVHVHSSHIFIHSVKY